jgi:hypothetical protein
MTLTKYPVTQHPNWKLVTIFGYVFGCSQLGGNESK